MDEKNIDFKQMYLVMARAAEKSLRLLEQMQPIRAQYTLIEAQRVCEQLYIEAGEK